MRPGAPKELVFVPFDLFLLKGHTSPNASAPLTTRSPKAEALELVFVVAPSGQDFDT
jgi:hypothetical protein